MRIRVDAGLEAGRNRCQFFLTLPISLAIGGVYGAQLAETAGLPALGTVALGAVGLSTFVYVQLILEPMVVHHFADDSGRFDTAIAFTWDAVIGAVVGLPLFWAIGVAPLPALAAAAGAGFGYGWLAGWVVCGDAVDIALGGVFGSLSGKRRRPDYSEIDTLAARGDYESARIEYEKVLANDPGHLGVAIKLARMLSDHMGRPADAVAVIRESLQASTPKPEQWAFALRILTEICTVKLGDEALALDDLGRLAAADAEGASGDWARMRMSGIETQE